MNVHFAVVRGRRLVIPRSGWYIGLHSIIRLSYPTVSSVRGSHLLSNIRVINSKCCVTKFSLLLYCKALTSCFAFTLLLLVAILKPDLSKPLMPTTLVEGLPELIADMTQVKSAQHSTQQ